MNNIFIDGYLCADAELRCTQNGKKVTSARIIHHDIPGDDGMPLSLVAWAEKADDLAQYKRGNLINVFGRLTLHKWTDKAGKDRAEYELEVEGVVKSSTPAKPKQKFNPMDYCPKIPGVNAPAENDPDYSFSENE